MRSSRILILLFVIFTILTYITIAECGEVAVMFTENFYSLGEDCELYPLKSYNGKVIAPLYGYLMGLKLGRDNSERRNDPLFMHSDLLHKWTELILEYTKKVKPQTLRDMKRTGWKITSVEVLNEGFYTLDVNLREYARNENHAHI